MAIRIDIAADCGVTQADRPPVDLCISQRHSLQPPDHKAVDSTTDGLDLVEISAPAHLCARLLRPVLCLAGVGPV